MASQTASRNSLRANPQKSMPSGEEAFQRIKKKLCAAPVLGMPIENGINVINIDASMVAISGIFHQEQMWNRRSVLKPIAYGSKVE